MARVLWVILLERIGKPCKPQSGNQPQRAFQWGTDWMSVRWITHMFLLVLAKQKYNYVNFLLVITAKEFATIFWGDQPCQCWVKINISEICVSIIISIWWMYICHCARHQSVKSLARPVGAIWERVLYVTHFSNSLCRIFVNRTFLTS
jgi:hypothetical protein